MCFYLKFSIKFLFKKYKPPPPQHTWKVTVFSMEEMEPAVGWRLRGEGRQWEQIVLEEGLRKGGERSSRQEVGSGLKSGKTFCFVRNLSYLELEQSFSWESGFLVTRNGQAVTVITSDQRHCKKKFMHWKEGSKITLSQACQIGE